jgi:hypothetical protein
MAGPILARAGDAVNREAGHASSVPEVKRFDAALRWIVRKLRLLIDAADERVHALEVKLRKESVTAANTTPGKVGRGIDRAAISGESCDRNKKARSAELSQPRSGVGNPAGYGQKRRRAVTAADFDRRSAARLHDLARDFEVAWSGR